MTNITSIPTLACPEMYDMTKAFYTCTNLTTTVDFSDVRVGMVWTSAFEGCANIPGCKIGFFKSGSAYDRVFAFCTRLTGISDLDGTDSFINFDGWVHSNMFHGCTQFILPMVKSGKSSIYITFPESRSIAGAFWETNALGSSTSTRQWLSVSAPYATYADNLFLYPAEGANTRRFRILDVSLPRLIGGQNIFGGITISQTIQVTIIPPNNTDPVNHNPLNGMAFDSFDDVNLIILHDRDVPEMANTVTPVTLEMIRMRNTWAGVQLNYMEVDMADINNIQNYTYDDNVSSVAYRRVMKFYTCTFTNKTGISKLDPVDTTCSLYCTYCPDVTILRNCLSSTHTLNVT